MPAIVTRLRIAGFKSFAEPTTIDILPGLTGIVGPNGCGKSNVVEALRWAMGETNARTLRGGEMDEIIFAGSAARPARSIAEVVVTLDDAAGLAPPPLQGEHELQISRRIERGAGSTYRVNGREVRARDVQTIFADIASGARSSAMVSQGRVAFLVDARPEDRRSVLEEAAGITGLHARRHEAELRLRAAEANLARVADLRADLESRHSALTGQAEAARAYREAVEAVGIAERVLLAEVLGRAARVRADCARAAVTGRQDLAAAEQAAGRAADAEHDAEAALADANPAVARSVASIEDARAECAVLQADERRATEALDAADARLAENTLDHETGQREAEAAGVAQLELAREAEAIERNLATATGRLTAAEEAGQSAMLDVARETERSRRRGLADAEAVTAQAAASSADQRAATATAGLAEARAELPAAGAIERAEQRLAVASGLFEAARDALAQSDLRRRDAEAAASTAKAEAARLRDLASRAEDRRTIAQKRRDRLAGECHDAAARLDDAERARVDPAERARLAAAAAGLQRTVAASIASLERAERQRAETADASDTAAARALDAAARARDAADLLERTTRERDRLSSARATLAAEQARLEVDLVCEADLLALRAAASAEADGLETARRAVATAEQAHQTASAGIGAVRTAVAALDAERAAAVAELGALSAAGGDPADGALPADLAVPEALEPALAAALGDALAASLDLRAARHWRDLGPSSASLPAAATPLLGLLAAPPALARALSQTGLIDRPADGLALQSALRPGQVLVTADGSLFRWDGLVVRGGEVTRDIERLRVRRRTAFCRLAIAAADAGLAEGARELAAATAGRDEAIVVLTQARADVALREAALAAAREAASALANRQMQARTRADANGVELARVEAALAEASANLAVHARDAAAGDASLLGVVARDARLAAQAAAAAERDARQSLRADEAAAVETDRAARQIAALDDEAAALRATLQPVFTRLTDELAAAEAELGAASHDQGGILAAAAAHHDRSSREVAEHDAAQSTFAIHREAHAAASVELDEARALQADLDRRRRDATARLAIFEPEARSALAAAGAAASRLQDAAAARTELGPETGALDAAVTAQATTLRLVADLQASQAQDRQRQTILAAALPDASRRREAALERTAALRLRLDETGRQRDGLREQLPALAEASRAAQQGLDAHVAAHAAAVTRAGDRQVACLAERDRRRAADLALSAARESLQRAELLASQAETREAEIRAEAGGIEPAERPTAASEADARRRLAAAMVVRDASGPVNLLAESEAVVVRDRLATLVAEADELQEAIARLRGSIGHLNREGRERLAASFVQIDAQFRALFGRMFDGGRAHLAMVGSDDPLQAGLEIYAQPPGKKLATLSLLSGGEQALTALSLIFAVFRCNPAPVCVLDEVDAPLDDANVERFSRLVSDMARETGTRFLVVTHHPLTMAGMDRLYGVTMQERGVSRLLSVDLGAAAAMAG